MTSEISNISSVKPTISSKLTQANTAPAAEKLDLPAKPQIVAPKPADIHFDPIKAQQNIQQAISLLNQQMAATSRGLGFSYDDSKKTPVIKVTDANSGEVVRQIPSEEALKFAHHIDALKGMLYNKIA